MSATVSPKKRKIRTSMFMSYLLIITLCFILYAALAIFESYNVGKDRIEKEGQVQVQAVCNELDQRLLTAKTMASTINTSSTLKKLGVSVLSDKILNSYTLYSILSDLKMIRGSANRLDIEEMIIFLNDYSKAYSYTGVVALDHEYEQEYVSHVKPLTVDTISNVIGVNADAKLQFLKKGLLYSADYSYSNGLNRGTICILFNMDNFVDSIEGIVGDGGYEVYSGENLILSGGNITGEPFSVESSALSGVTINVYPTHMAIFAEGIGQALVILLLVGAALTGGFILIAYHFTKYYYKPFGNIKDLVTTGTETTSEDEMDSILNGIKELIGERNGYREKMLTIAPYVEQGMLHGMVTDKIENDTVKLHFHEEYLDLKKPFYTAAVINFYTNSGNTEEEYIADVCAKTRHIFSSEEIKIVTYRKDAFNVFLVVNADSDNPMDDLFFQIHKFIVESTSEKGCMVTLGIDEVRDDISQLGEACNRALQALDGMMMNGRGEVYFYESDSLEPQATYYFPKNSVMKLNKYVKERNIDEIHKYLDEIYQKNMDKSEITTYMLHALIDELHVTTLKCIKENTELSTTHISLQKITTIVTLEEVFHYYFGAFETLVNQLNTEDEVAQGKNVLKLDQTIVSYIEENYCNSNMSLQHLTDKFGVSSKFITLVCKRILGKTYSQYLQDKRIYHAVELLETTDESVEKIGELCGYINSLTFRRNFKAVTGTTPSEYRTK